MPKKPAPAPSELGPIKTNLRASATSFVGRERDLEGIGRAFDEGARLVTLLGVGGIGKTRVATRFLERAAPAYSTPGAGGAWFCDLTDARSATAAIDAVAGVLGIRPPAADDRRALARAVGAAVASRKAILVVLDNLEQLAADADTFVGEWLRAAPRARFLVTSRVALGLEGEQRWPLAPLPLPAAGASLDSLRRTPSVDLFVARARQIDPELELEGDALRQAADVVTGLEGIPLAIELAAARLGVLTIAELKERLASPLALLVGAGSGRHGSMRRAIVDSYEALGPDERRALVGAAVFAGGFTLATAEAILGTAERPVLAALEKLRSHSLLRVQRGPRGERRFALFEPIREFALEELGRDPGLLEVARDAHAAHYAARAVAFREGPGSAAEREAIAFEVENLRAALAASAERAGSAAAAVALALALDPVLEARGLSRERIAIAASSIAAAGRDALAPSSTLAALYVARGRARRLAGELRLAGEDYASALDIARTAECKLEEARAELWMGELVETEGETVAARERFARAESIARALGDDRAAQLLVADIDARTAHALRREHRLVEAEERIHAAIHVYRREGLAERLASTLYEAGVVALFREHLDHAKTRFLEAHEIARSAGARYVESLTASVLGILEQELGDLTTALARHGEAVAIAREIGSGYRELSALTYLAGAYLERGQDADALRTADRALDLVRVVGAPRYEVLVEVRRGLALAHTGDRRAAGVAIEQAARAAAVCATEPSLETSVRIHALHVGALEEGGDALARALDQARKLEGARANDDPRFALRCLEARARQETSAAPAHLDIGEGGRWFRLPGTRATVDLSRRRPLSRIVAALAERRLDASGEGLSVDELFAAGWPGERARGEAMANRVYVALTTLRNLGLRGMLVSRTNGYVLDPGTPVRMAVVDPDRSP